MRADRAVKRKSDLFVFSFAVMRSTLGQIFYCVLLHKFSEQNWVRAIGKAEHIVEALCRGIVDVGERGMTSNGPCHQISLLAQALGIAIPLPLSGRADEVID
jgi:hypothetical protein